MREIFLKILIMGINASWLIVAIVALRLLFRRAPKWIFGCLWMLAGLRLICPVSIESSFSLIPSGWEMRQDSVIGEKPDSVTGNENEVELKKATTNESADTGTGNKTEAGARKVLSDTETRSGNKYSAGMESRNNTENGNGAKENGNADTGKDKPSMGNPVTGGNGSVAGWTEYRLGNLLQRLNLSSGVIRIMAVVWLGGVTLMLFYLAGSYFYLRRKLSTATNYRENIWESEFVDSPFILGFIAPRIYIPYHVEPQKLAYVLAHENAHLKRKDHWIKAVAFCILALYWFHPLVWLGYVLLCRDIEFACDEKVVRDLDSEARKEYLLTLLNCNVLNRGGRKTRAGIAPLAFGEVGIKKRIMHVKKFKRKSVGFTTAILLVCLLVTGCLMMNPAKTEQTKQGQTGTENSENKNMTKTASNSKNENLLEVKPASVDLTGYVGPDLRLCYVDSKKLIFSVGNGLFVHDKETGKNVKSLDLEYIGCEQTQGDYASQIAVSKTGEKVYLLSIKPGHKGLYIFDMSADTLKKETYPETKDLLSDKSLSVFHVTDQLYTIYKDGKKKKYCMLGFGMDRTAVSSIYSDKIYKRKESSIESVISYPVSYPLFLPEEYENEKLLGFGPEDIHDVVKIEMRIGGKMNSVTDPSLCKKMEKMLGSEANKTGSSACSFDDPMYITRSDGVTGLIWPATDGDNAYLSEKGYFEVKNGENMLNLLGGWQDKLVKAKKSAGK